MIDLKIPKETSRGFYGWMVFFFLLLIGFSIFVTVCNNLSLKPYWFFIILPILSMFVYAVASFKYHILFRSSLIFVPLISTSMIILISVEVVIAGLFSDFSISIISSTIFFIAFGMVGLVVGLFTAMIITKHEPLDDNQIDANSATFEFIGDQKHNEAIRRVLSRCLFQFMGYWIFTEEEGYTVYKSNIAGTGKRIISLFHEDGEITFFPYIRDGFFYKPNPDVLSEIKIIAENVVNLQATGNVASLAETFKDYSKMSKILELIKSIKNLKITEWIIIAVALGVFIIAAIFMAMPNTMDSVFDAIVIVALSIAGSIIGTLSINYIGGKIKKEK